MGKSSLTVQTSIIGLNMGLLDGTVLYDESISRASVSTEDGATIKR